MATRAVRSAELVNVPGFGMKSIDEIAKELERAKLRDNDTRAPGWYDDTDKIPAKESKWVSARFTRVLPENHGKIVFNVKPADDGEPWVDCQPNLRFKNGKPIPGFGGKKPRWKIYAKYFRDQITEDLKAVYAVADKLPQPRRRRRSKA